MSINKPVGFKTKKAPAGGAIKTKLGINILRGKSMTYKF